jgi:hypothetical protein
VQRQAQYTAVSTTAIAWNEEDQSSLSVNVAQASARPRPNASFVPRSCMKSSMKAEKVGVDVFGTLAVGE